MSENQRYNQNANLWRKVYSYGRRKPVISKFFDENLNVTRSLDLNNNFRHRDYFEIDGYNISGPEADWMPWDFQYDEGFIFFDNEHEKEAKFNLTFRANPYVVYQVVPTEDDSDNINVYGTSLPTTTKMFIGTSAPFKGHVHYIAMAAQSWSQPFVSGTKTDVYAGEIDLNNIDTFTANYLLPPTGSDYIYYNTVHDNFNNTANVKIENLSKDNSNSENFLYTKTKNKLHFIVFRVE